MDYNKEYKKLVETILTNGTEVDSRNSLTLAIPHYSFTIDDMEDDWRLLLRKLYVKGIYGEFLTLIDPTPLTNVSQFEANDCNYWKLWSGESGYINIDYHNKLHPRLANLISEIKADPTSRRHIINLWDQDNVDSGELSLPCCWNQLTFSVIGKKLHLTWTQRSVDTMIGLPSDVYLAHLFMSYVAIHTSLEVGSCMFSLSNVHIYSQHTEGAKELLTRTEADYDKPLKFKLEA